MRGGRTTSGKVGSGSGLWESEGPGTGLVSVANAGWVPKKPKDASSKANPAARTRLIPVLNVPPVVLT